MSIFFALFLALSPLDEALLTIEKAPACQPLIQQVKKEGGFRVVEASRTPFEAQWNPDTRTIEVDTEQHRGVGHLVTSILFELHNALSNKRLNHLYALAEAKRIPRDLFVKKMEQMEWRNWEAASLLLSKGRKSGHFPQDAHLPTFVTFKNYLKVQESMGHSQYHAHSYDQL